MKMSRKRDRQIDREELKEDAGQVGGQKKKQKRKKREQKDRYRNKNIEVDDLQVDSIRLQEMTVIMETNKQKTYKYKNR